MRVTIYGCLFALVLASTALPAAGQQTNVGTRNVTSGDSFSEFTGSSWNASGKNWFFGFGGGAPGGGAAPPFGGAPGGLSGGFGFAGGGMSGGFGFTAGQGYSSTLGSTSGSITSLNGTQGYLFNGTLTPFVTEITPVVGSPVMRLQSPVAAKLESVGGVQGLRPPLRVPHSESALGNERATSHEAGGPGSSKSTAERGVSSVAAIHREQAEGDAALEVEIDRYVAEAASLEAAGDNRAAAFSYSKAAAKVEGERRAEFLRRARELRTK